MDARVPVVLALLVSSVFLARPARALTTLPYELEPAKPRSLRTAIRVESNTLIERWIDEFTGPFRDRFAGFLDRGAYYKALIQDILVKEGVPPEFYYLAMIESGFEFDATSWVRAKGIWQFMPSTARLYGLRVDETVDERLDVFRATRAAAAYLKELKARFGSWYLAMAAYNAGEGRVARAIRRGGSRNYWTLVRRGALPRETSKYVAKFQAAMAIARDPARFGFSPKPAYEYPRVRKLAARANETLAALAERVGQPVELIRALNPHLSDAVPGYAVWVAREDSARKLRARAAARAISPAPAAVEVPAPAVGAPEATPQEEPGVAPAGAAPAALQELHK